jgi:hypothetical protein
VLRVRHEKSSKGSSKRKARSASARASIANVTITISFPMRSDPVASGEQLASGTVTDVADDAFVLRTDDGSDVRLHMAAAKLADLGLQPCDTLDVCYHQDAGMLIADRVDETGVSTTGDCAFGGDERDVVETITQVSGDGLTVQAPDEGAMTFSVDSSDVTDGYQAGDIVDVT